MDWISLFSFIKTFRQRLKSKIETQTTMYLCNGFDYETQYDIIVHRADPFET